MSGVKARFATVLFPPEHMSAHLISCGAFLLRTGRAKTLGANANRHQEGRNHLKLLRALIVHRVRASHGTEERRVAATLTAAAPARVAISPVPTPGAVWGARMSKFKVLR